MRASVKALATALKDRWGDAGVLLARLDTIEAQARELNAALAGAEALPVEQVAALARDVEDFRRDMLLALRGMRQFLSVPAHAGLVAEWESQFETLQHDLGNRADLRPCRAGDLPLGSARPGSRPRPGRCGPAANGRPAGEPARHVGGSETGRAGQGTHRTARRQPGARSPGHRSAVRPVCRRLPRAPPDRFHEPAAELRPAAVPQTASFVVRPHVRSVLRRVPAARRRLVRALEPLRPGTGSS